MNLSSSQDRIPPYEPAYVYNGKKEWFIAYRYYSLTQQKYIRQKIRIGLKNISLQDRVKRLEALKREINIIIEQRNRDGIYDEVVKGISKQGNDIFSAIVIIQKDATVKESTQSDIKGFKYNYTKFIKDYQFYDGLELKNLGKELLTDYVFFLQKEKYASKTINKYLWVIQYITEYLQSKNYIESSINTEHYRVKQIKNETGLFRPLTHKEKQTVFDYCQQYDPHFYLYLSCIYYSCIRPKELRRLKIRDFNLNSKCIHVEWMNAKNGLSKYVQILEPLYMALEEANVRAFNSDWYIFSTKFTPGESTYKGVSPSEYWRNICNKLNIDKTANMYGLKHTFNLDFVEQNKKNIDWEWLRRHNRHATVQQTQDYISGMSAYFLDESKNTILNYHNTLQ